MKMFNRTIALMLMSFGLMLSVAPAQAGVADNNPMMVVLQESFSGTVNKQQAIEIIESVCGPLHQLPAGSWAQMSADERASYREMISAIDSFLELQNMSLDQVVETYENTDFQAVTNWLVVTLIVILFVGPLVFSEMLSTVTGFTNKGRI